MRTKKATIKENILEAKTSKMKKKNLLSSHGGDLKKRWYVRYTDRGTDGKTSTKKVYGGINTFKTIKERTEAAEIIIEALAKDVRTVKDQTVEIENQIKIKLHDSLEKIRPRVERTTYWTYYSKLKNFLLWINEENLYHFNQLTNEVITSFLNGLLDDGLSNVTYNAYKNTISSLFKEIKDVNNPFKNIDNLRKKSVPPKYFNKTDIKRLRNVIDDAHPQLWLACQMMYYCLIRPNELRCLKLSEIDLEESRIRITAIDAKNNVTQSVTIPEQLHAILEAMNLHRYKNDDYLFGNKNEPGTVRRKKDYFSKQHQAIISKEGYDTEKYKFYSWKHSGAVAVVKNKVPEKLIQLQGRWHSLSQLDNIREQKKPITFLGVIGFFLFFFCRGLQVF